MQPRTRSTPRSRKHDSARKRRISAAPDRLLKPPKYQNLTKFDKIRILDALHERPAGVKLYEMIPVLREMGYATIVAPTLSRLLREESAIRTYVESNPQRFQPVRIEFLAPNLTAWVQPMDGGIIASFKAQYKRRFVRMALDRNNLGIANMYKIDQLQAMHMAGDAWKAVAPQTIANCWRHVGLVPDHYVLNALPPPPPPPPMFAYPPYQVHTPPPFHPAQYNYGLAPANIHPESQQALGQLDLDLITENWWIEGEIVNQIIAERQEGFFGEDEEEYDLGDFHYYHNPHI